jgi:ribonuclease P/MRP protein subunit POP1
LEISSLLQRWPTHIPSTVKLFDAPSRTVATTYLETHTRGSLQKARNELLSEGKPPTLPSSEPIIPSLLLRRDSGSWTLLLPWSWVNEFWYLFIHYPQARFGGATEYTQIYFEKGIMAFPDDWPGTDAGDAFAKRLSRECKERWDRRPNGKKESWEKILKGLERKEVGDPFTCDWGLLFNKTDEKNEVPKETEKSIELIREQAKAAMEREIDLSTLQSTPFLLSPEYSRQLLLRKSVMIPSVDLSTALIPIRIRFLQKGNVSFRARIYRLPVPEEVRQPWINLLSEESKFSERNHPNCPGEQDLLGFVTTGNVSLSEGRGKAVGAFSWDKALSEEERWADCKEFRRLCIVRDVGTNVGRLAKWEING